MRRRLVTQGSLYATGSIKRCAGAEVGLGDAARRLSDLASYKMSGFPMPVVATYTLQGYGAVTKRLQAHNSHGPEKSCSTQECSAEERKGSSVGAVNDGKLAIRQTSVISSCLTFRSVVHIEMDLRVQQNVRTRRTSSVAPGPVLKRARHGGRSHFAQTAETRFEDWGLCRSRMPPRKAAQCNGGRKEAVAFCRYCYPDST